MRKDVAPPALTPAPLLLPPSVRASAGVAAAKPKGFPVGAAAKKAGSLDGWCVIMLSVASATINL